MNVSEVSPRMQGILRRLFFIVLAIFLMVPVAAGAADLKDLVQQLGADGFAAKEKAIGELGGLGDPRAVQILQALADGDLYTDADNKVVRAEESGDGFATFDP